MSEEMNVKALADGFRERLRTLIGSDSVRSFAVRAGIKQSTLHGILTDKLPGFETLTSIYLATGADPHWLLTGEQRPQPGTPPAAALISTNPAPNIDDFFFIPRLDIHASAGHGAVSMHEEPIEMLAFREDWLRKRGINPRYAAALTARGDSMDPIIRDGDVLLVDTSINEVKDNGIYVVIVGGLVVVKRVHMHIDRSISLISENKTYPPEKILSHELPSVSFAGRVMWFGRSI